MTWSAAKWYCLDRKWVEHLGMLIVSHNSQTWAVEGCFRKSPLCTQYESSIIVIEIYKTHIKLEQPNYCTVAFFFYQDDIAWHFESTWAKTWLAGKNGHPSRFDPVGRVCRLLYLHDVWMNEPRQYKFTTSKQCLQVIPLRPPSTLSQD